MKTRTLTLLFVLVAAVIAGVFIHTKKYSSKESSLTRAKIITPKSSTAGDNGPEKKLSSSESEKYETFVPLSVGETLISTLTMDFNNDGYDDEIIVVRVNTSPNLYIVPGIYEPETGNYNRCAPIPTTFTRTRTFSYQGMDLIGDHTNALIYQGVDDSGNYVMQIFRYKENNSNTSVERIANFETDGTVFIQQTERSESYELSLSKGESFSVWVYESEKTEGEDGKPTSKPGANQIQREYKWDAGIGHYILANEIKVTAGRLAATELSKIQDGTEETFASFLNGLWYKTSNTDGNIRYLFFDYENREIIQFYSDIQEVYQWQDSKLRHNGIYLTTVNSDIMNLHRRFDIALVAVDEIRLTLRDDVNLLIKENTMWDGSYRKMSSQSTFDSSSLSSPITKTLDELRKGPVWTSADTLITMNFDELTYTLQTNSLLETGIYTGSTIGTYNVIQFRPDTDSPLMGNAYSVEFGTKTISETVKKKTVERVVTDYDTVMFTPVKITPTDCFSAEGKVFTFTR